MKAEKTVVAKIFALTRKKQNLLEQEYLNFQLYLRGLKTAKLYSATKQQAERFVKQVRRRGGQLKEDKEYPLIIRRDVFKLEEKDRKLTRYWAKIPVYGVHGGVWVPLKLSPEHKELLKEVDSIRETKLVRRDDGWSLHIVVQKDVEVSADSPILAVDLGQKYMAVTVELWNGEIKNPRFYGKEVRGIRRHFRWLRRELGKKQLLGKIKQLGQKEQRKVENVLHGISRRIVDRADKIGGIIVFGDLKGITNSVKGKGKMMNRMVSNMPYLKLTRYTKYKASWKGVSTFLVDEKTTKTSITCHRCGNRGVRPTQGLFRCSNCQMEYNADLNGAINIGRVFLDKLRRAYVEERGIGDYAHEGK